MNLLVRTYDETTYGLLQLSGHHDRQLVPLSSDWIFSASIQAIEVAGRATKLARAWETPETNGWEIVYMPTFNDTCL
ncbi:hypothetical protein PISMIDRAFT_679688, partial [Pisolithus microcarpus 441]